MFTKHKDFYATLWDGEYSTYSKLCHEESDFVGVLDDSTGKEVLKVFTGNGWQDCYPGEYVAKSISEGKPHYFSVKSPYV